jgi:hypothetical protein
LRPRTTFASLVLFCCFAFAAPACAGQTLVVDLSQADAPTQMLVTSIQGVVNRDPAAVGIYVVRGPQDAIWLSLYRGDIATVTPDELVAKVRDRLAGQVLYDPAQEHSVNLAAAAAAILNAALTTKDLGLKTLLDARGKWADRLSAYRYAVAQVMPEAATDRIALIGTGRTDLRDYLAKERVLAVDLDPRDREQASLLREILTRLKPGALVFGAPELAGDAELLQLLAERQDLLVPVSYAANLSFHSAHPAFAPLRQPTRLAPLAYQVMVTFVYEGGTDLGFALGPMRALWDDPARGTVPLGWTISPALLDVAPPVFQSYCAGAWRSGNDELVLGPNGPGYFAPSATSEWKPVLDRLAPWVRAGDLRTAAIADSGPGEGLQRALAQYANAGVRGALLGPGAKISSGLYGSLAVAAQAVRATDTFETLQAIRRAGETSKYIYVSVDPASLTPSDIAYIVGRLGPSYMVLRPREFLEVARQTTATHSQKPKKGTAAISEIALRPETPKPEDQVEVDATVRAQARLDSVQAVYTIAGAPVEWTVPLTPGPDDGYSGSLPPILGGGKITVRVRATDADNAITWSDPATFEVKAPDSDDDGLSDAVEKLLRTDPANPDTDADGWRDGNDRHPLLPDHFGATYLWPLAPPGDAPYVTEGGGKVTEHVRAVSGDQTVVYELPLSGAPPGSHAVFQAAVGGEYRLEASKDGKQWQEVGSASSDVPIAPGSWEIPADYMAAGSLRARLSSVRPGRTPERSEAAPGSKPQGGAPARLAGLSIAANPDGPSILMLGTDPDYPAVGLRTYVLATVFDPDGVAGVKLNYSINDGGTIAVPMEERGRSQVFAAEVHGAVDGDNVTYWVTATGGKGKVSASRVLSFHVGVVRQETISLLPERDCEGPWQLGIEWQGSRWSPGKDSTDMATINITGGAYRVWVLAAPRGGGIRVDLDGKPMGTSEPMARDGWQSLGTIDLARGKHEVSLTSASDARCGYAQVLVTQDRRTIPPEGAVRDLYNSVTVITPLPGETVAGLVSIEVTATGNVAAMECSVDGGNLGRQTAAPYRFRWNARRAAAGTHTIEVRAYDHADNLLLTTTLSAEIGK